MPEQKNKAMRSPRDNVGFELLRVRYAELLRLREYVERLENLRQEDAESTQPLTIFKSQKLANGRRASRLSSSTPWRKLPCNE
jgi:hypothetical protein